MNLSANTGYGEERSFEEQMDKYVLFGLDGETYCLPIIKIQEIIADYKLTQLPNLPKFYHGVISLRGEAIPVVNLRKRFELGERPRDRRTRIIIVDLEPTPIGIQVDEVQRVASVARSAIDQPPVLSGGAPTPFIAGVTEINEGRFTILLDIEEILTSFERIQLSEMRDTIQQEYEQRSNAPFGEDDFPFAGEMPSHEVSHLSMGPENGLEELEEKQ